ncbi:MAG: hemerythrin domain-containing protein [Firmicutes bacterium]|nr:hemerythrin domain-containing protein [Bacillota bacterium]
MGKATIDLVKEHETIIHVLELLNKIQKNDKLSEASQIKFYGELAYFLEIFADKCHHGKEEVRMYHILIPLCDELEKNLIVALIEEHVKARAIVREIKAAVEAGSVEEAAQAAKKYSILLHDHIREENEVMFPSLEKRITEKQQEIMYERFQQVEEQTLGGGVKDKLIMMIDSWENELI